MHTFKAPVSARVKAQCPKAVHDHFMVGQYADFVEYAKTIPHIASVWGDKLSNGDASSVAESDRYLVEMDSLIPAPSTRHEIADDVTGAFPNVPAYIAGQPLSMRRKVKRANEFAPLVVVADLSSSGAISSAQIYKRGVAILALVRLLASRRPVELWIGASWGGPRETPSDSFNLYYQLETAPLDLARAAWLISSPNASRDVTYSCIHKAQNGYHTNGWQYQDMGKAVALFGETLRGGFPHATDVLALPAAQLGDQSIRDPIAWIKRNAAQYGEAAPEE